MILKEKSKFVVVFKKKEQIMNLHEECLLKYLLNPMDLFRSTEILKLNNNLIEKGLLKNGFVQTQNIKYSVNRI